MTFIREQISKEDFEKYQIGRFQERIPNSIFPNSSYWAIDRERNIYLVTASSGGREPETYDRNQFIFFVEGDTYVINISVTLTKLEEKYWHQDYTRSTWNLSPYFSTSNKPKKQLNEIPPIFKEAIQTYRISGKDDLTTKVDFTFDF